MPKEHAQHLKPRIFSFGVQFAYPGLLPLLLLSLLLLLVQLKKLLRVVLL